MKVHYGSFLAKVFLPRRYHAITVGQRVFTRAAWLSPAVLRHEAAHARQWRRYGVTGFLGRYLWYHVRYGYGGNPLEIEARQAE